MAISLESIRDKAGTSIHGRRVKIMHDDMLGGFKGVQTNVVSATAASTGTNLPSYGYITIESSAAKTHKLEAPTPGVKVEFSSITTSTLVRTISPVSGTIISTNGVVGSSFTFNGLGDSIGLVGISTAKWMVTHNRSVIVSS